MLKNITHTFTCHMNSNQSFQHDINFTTGLLDSRVISKHVYDTSWNETFALQGYAIKLWTTTKDGHIAIITAHRGALWA
jgi:hypothetical protein